MKRIKEAFLGKTSSQITTRNKKKMNNQEKESAVESPRSVSVKNGDGDKIQGQADPSGKPRTEFEEFIEVIKVGAENSTKYYIYGFSLIIFFHLKKTDLLADQLSSPSFTKIISAFFKLRVSLWFPVYVH